MKFVVSSLELLSHLNAIGKVINSKNTLPILDNYLFRLEAGKLEITASDMESTLVTSMELDNIEGEGLIAIPAKVLNEILRGFPEQPLTFQIDTDKFAVELFSENGVYNISGQDGEEYPQFDEIDSSANSMLLASEVLYSGITHTVFATTDDTLRPILGGVLFDFGEEELVFVGSDSHKLVRYGRSDVKTEEAKKFVLPKKPANLLKNLLVKEDTDVELSFDSKNAVFKMSKYTLVCRLLEGKYPAYNSIIPKGNPNVLHVDCQALHNTVKRVSVFASESSNQITFSIDGSHLKVSAQDVDFARSAEERIACHQEGESVNISFKSGDVIEILSNIDSNEVRMEFSDSTRAGLFFPSEKKNDAEELLVLLMPMTFK